MRKVNVEVLEDASHPEGGYAVVLLHGLAGLPDGVTFRLKPVEARGTVDAGHGVSWPQGEQRPRAVRRTEAGIELLIGPDIVECPALLPGTLGVIEIGAAGVRGEFLWPSIRPTARPRRRNLSVVKPQSVPADRSGRTAVRDKARAAAQPVMTAEAAVADGAGQAGSRRVLREASSGAVAQDGDAGPSQAVPMTALDHAVPATATVAEAIGGNVVQLNAVREAASAAAAGDKSGQTREARQVDGIVAHADHEERLPAASRSPARAGGGGRFTAAAAIVAVVISGGYLFFSDRLDRSGRPTPEANAASTRAQSVTVEVVASVPSAAASSRLDRVTDPLPVEPQHHAMLSAEPAPTVGEAVATVPPAADPPVPAPAPLDQEVTLRMRGGGFQISGNLKGFDGAKYVIETRSAGVLTMDAARFECVGDACGRPAAAILPLSERPSPVKPDQFRIEGAPSLAAEFIPQLIRDYANSIGATAAMAPRDSGTAGTALGGVRYRLLDQRAVELATIEVHATGTAAGLSSLERGAAMIALLDRPQVLEPEPRGAPRVRRRSGQAPAVQPTEIMIGLDGVAAVTAQQSALPSISVDLLAKVAAGQITDWYELGQSPGPIQVYLPPDGTGTLETFARLVMRPRGLDFARAARRLPGDAEVAEAVTRDPRGIGLVSLATQRSARPVSLETACGLVVRPTGFAVKTGEYPLVRRLSMKVAPQLVQPSARGLARIAQSGEVQHAVAAGRVVDQSIASLPIEEQAERMAWAANAPAAAFDAVEFRQMLADLNGASRLSVTFRFVSGTNELDQRSRLEVQRLAAALREPELAGKRIILAGFTDAAGRYQANVSAAVRRATQVRAALLAAAGTGFDHRLVQSKGYGPLAPVGCNGTPEGTRLNRRVEVWVAG